MLKDYLWEIFECAKEERTDGDNLNGDMEIAPNLFVEGITGNPQHQYKVLSEIDVPAAKAKWISIHAPRAGCDDGIPGNIGRVVEITDWRQGR